MTTVARTVSRDESLPHQIVIGTGRYDGEISVSCNCRSFGYGYTPMDHVPVGEDALLKAKNIYNNPANHYPVPGEPPFHPDLNNYKSTRHVEVIE